MNPHPGEQYRHRDGGRLIVLRVESYGIQVQLDGGKPYWISEVTFACVTRGQAPLTKDIPAKG